MLLEFVRCIGARRYLYMYACVWMSARDCIVRSLLGRLFTGFWQSIDKNRSTVAKILYKSVASYFNFVVWCGVFFSIQSYQSPLHTCLWNWRRKINRKKLPGKIWILYGIKHANFSGKPKSKMNIDMKPVKHRKNKENIKM